MLLKLCREEFEDLSVRLTEKAKLFFIFYYFLERSCSSYGYVKSVTRMVERLRFNFYILASSSDKWGFLLRRIYITGPNLGKNDESKKTGMVQLVACSLNRDCSTLFKKFQLLDTKYETAPIRLTSFLNSFYFWVQKNDCSNCKCSNHICSTCVVDIKKTCAQ